MYKISLYSFTKEPNIKVTIKNAVLRVVYAYVHKSASCWRKKAFLEAIEHLQNSFTYVLTACLFHMDKGCTVDAAITRRAFLIKNPNLLLKVAGSTY